MQSVPVTTKVVSFNPAHWDIYLMQHYMLKFVIVLHQVGGFCPGTLVYTTKKTDCHDITEIFLKVALSTITLTLRYIIFSI